MSTGWRIGVIGLIFLGLFTLLTLRLWGIQLTEAQAYEEQAQRAQVDVEETPAPRGDIVDRNGMLLAGTRTSLAVVVDRQLIPRDVEPDVIQRLSVFLSQPASAITEAFAAAGSGNRFTLATDLTQQQALFVMERRQDFPGVVIEPQPIRHYPLGAIAGQVIGYLGKPDASDLGRAGVDVDSPVGKAGVEREYDSVLLGVPGFVKYRINAQGAVLEVLGEQAPVPGHTVVTNLDMDLQQVLESALVDGLDLARRLSDSGAGCVPGPEDPGCPVRAVGVVLDPSDGAVLAMASIPEYDPNLLSDGISESEWEQLQGGQVLNNFAIQGQYEPASAFKAVAFHTALEETVYPRAISPAGEKLDGIYLSDPDDLYLCDGVLTFRDKEGSAQLYRDWKWPLGHGMVDLEQALETSCDLYFWEVALHIWRDSGTRGDGYAEDLLQQWSRRFGFGSDTGVDLPFEARGIVGDREWFTELQEAGSPLVRSEGVWAGGDLLNMVIGQGTITATPLQLANAYAAMVNGGVVWEPRVVDRVIDDEGQEILINPASRRRTVDVAPETAARFKSALRRVVTGENGTAVGAFADFGPNVNQVGGKTGTAEVIKDPDINTAWFVGVAPMSDPRYVVAVVVERGGSGGRIAAPVARQVLQYILNGPDGVTPLVPGLESD